LFSPAGEYGYLIELPDIPFSLLKISFYGMQISINFGVSVPAVWHWGIKKAREENLREPQTYIRGKTI